MKNFNIEDKIRRALSGELHIYPDSLRFSRELAFFILKDSKDKYLGVMGPENAFRVTAFSGQVGNDVAIDSSSDQVIRLYERNSTNLKILVKIFPGLQPCPLGKSTSFGFGDRLGLANAAHIRIIEKQKGILPVLAQQSVRELLKTGKDFEKVVGLSIWNILQEGYRGKWGADADHIKDKEYFIRAAEAGMTMFTLDTSDFLDEKVLDMTDSRIKEEYDIDSEYINLVRKNYLDKKISANGYILEFNEEVLIKLALVYGKALQFTREIFEFLSGKLDAFDYEVSFDETNTISTPEAHYFIVSEMRRLNIEFSSLALRFPGTFEKGIDYIGNIKDFEESIKVHGLICKDLGGYKLSLHSGSDKLSIYPAFNRFTEGIYHIKTSGTSWLESVRLAAVSDPVFFRELFGIAVDTFEENKKAYHVNLDLADIPKSIEQVKDAELPDLLHDSDLRRVFHIAYGVILERKKKQLMELLFKNEEKHYQYLEENFEKHFNALKR